MSTPDQYVRADGTVWPPPPPPEDRRNDRRVRHEVLVTLSAGREQASCTCGAPFLTVAAARRHADGGGLR